MRGRLRGVGIFAVFYGAGILLEWVLITTGQTAFRFDVLNLLGGGLAGAFVLYFAYRFLLGVLEYVLEWWMALFSVGFPAEARTVDERSGRVRP